jgi:hypothetical protein
MPKTQSHQPCWLCLLEAVRVWVWVPVLALVQVLVLEGVCLVQSTCWLHTGSTLTLQTVMMMEATRTVVVGARKMNGAQSATRQALGLVRDLCSLLFTPALFCSRCDGYAALMYLTTHAFIGLHRRRPSMPTWC